MAKNICIFPLHQSVTDRLEAEAVPQSGEVKPYRPHQLRRRAALAQFFED